MLMPSSRRFVGTFVAVPFAILAVVPFGAASAQGTMDRPGRYTMSPAEGGGFIRLDSETGRMSHCQRRDGDSAGDWTCREMGDPTRGLDGEIERLRVENQRLQGEIRQMEEILLSEKRSGSQRSKPELTLPSEKDIDEAMSYAQRMLRKFREKLKEIEGEVRGTPL